MGWDTVTIAALRVVAGRIAWPLNRQKSLAPVGFIQVASKVCQKISDSHLQNYSGYHKLSHENAPKRFSSLNTAFRQKGQPQHLVVGLFFYFYDLIVVI